MWDCDYGRLHFQKWPEYYFASHMLFQNLATCPPRGGLFSLPSWNWVGLWVAASINKMHWKWYCLTSKDMAWHPAAMLWASSGYMEKSTMEMLELTASPEVLVDSQHQMINLWVRKPSDMPSSSLRVVSDDLKWNRDPYKPCVCVQR